MKVGLQKAQSDFQLKTNMQLINSGKNFKIDLQKMSL